MRLLKAVGIAFVFLGLFSIAVCLLILALYYFGFWVIPAILFVFFTCLAYADLED